MPRKPEKLKDRENFPFRLPGRQEFQVLELLWAHSPLTVTQVREQWPGTPRLAYTTVMTMLAQLFRKGLVDRSKRGKAYLYVSRVGREELLQAIANKVLADFYRADPDRFQQALNGSPHPASALPEAAEDARPIVHVPAGRASRRSRPPAETPAPSPESILEDETYLL